MAICRLYWKIFSAFLKCLMRYRRNITNADTEWNCKNLSLVLDFCTSSSIKKYFSISDLNMMLLISHFSGSKYNELYQQKKFSQHQLSLLVKLVRIIQNFLKDLVSN
ncbi:unnamed protein product [Blepharisma stoltei]|uniref:Uncharacterized protein n=1 Tax=Blepharisma stoltei TaxID=1481888 RepID=A0AAU9K4F1_9CILI|nr:unnamed protein product [Blepharisma stoltei]